MKSIYLRLYLLGIDMKLLLRDDLLYGTCESKLCNVYLDTMHYEALENSRISTFVNLNRTEARPQSHCSVREKIEWDVINLIQENIFLNVPKNFYFDDLQGVQEDVISQEHQALLQGQHCGFPSLFTRKSWNMLQNWIWKCNGCVPNYENLPSLSNKLFLNPLSQAFERSPDLAPRWF